MNRLEIPGWGTRETKNPLVAYDVLVEAVAMRGRPRRLVRAAEAKRAY